MYGAPAVCPPPFEVLRREARVNQLPAFASHNLARKSIYLKKPMKQIFFLKEQKCTECGLWPKGEINCYQKI